MNEYIGLNNLRNKYPSIGNYKSNLKDRIKFTGLYNDNSIDFVIPALDNIQVVSGTSFSFIIKLKFNSDDIGYIGLYTSPTFYNNLIASKSESNPYYIQSAFIENFVINFYVDDITKTYTQLISNEIKDGVNVNRNLFYVSNNINAPLLIRYIDWVVSKPKLDDIDTNNVIPVEELGDFQLFDNIDNARLLETLESEKTNVEIAMRDITNYIKTPTLNEISSNKTLNNFLDAEAINYLINTDSSKLRESFRRIQLLPFSVNVIGNNTPSTFTLLNTEISKTPTELQLDLYTTRIKSELLRLSGRQTILQLQIEKLAT
jgi:hypothetical protein